MTFTVLPPVPAARKKGTVLAVTAGLTCSVLALLVAIAWWGFSGKVESASHRYARQLAKVELPSDYDVLKREQGGTYFAAGNGPYASVSYRTNQPLETTVAQVHESLQEAGYTVQVAPWYSPGSPVIRLEGTAHGRDIEALVGGGVIYRLPYGYVDAVVGTTGVLLVVEDHGRSR